MKRALSILLALIMALSCCTALSVSAADGDDAAAAEPVYLLGDADLDGEITILDATEIQRALASLTALSGLQTALSDIYGQGLDITCATAIQRSLAGLEPDLPIGEPAGDENEGVVYADTVMSYAGAGNQIMSEEDVLFFSTAYPGVAFISDSKVIENYCQSFGYAYEDTVAAAEGDIHGYKVPNGSAVYFDYQGKQLIFSDYSTTVTVNGSVPLNPFGNGLGAVVTIDPTKPSTLYEIQASSNYFGSDPCIATFDYDEVPMLKSGDDILVPLQVLSDFFLSHKSSYMMYNGKGVYLLGNNSSQSAPALWQQYTGETEKVTQVNPAMAQVNYYELCNVLEARYGLRKAHDIETFDSYFARRRLKEEFLSGDLERIENAQLLMGAQLFEDFHSSSAATSPYFDGKIEIDPDTLSPIYVQRSRNFNAMKQKRTSILGAQVAPYERRGDTVFITFDEFNLNSITKLYSEGFEPDPASGDTIELFAYALRRLQNEDSDIKNVVVDIACNGGGTTVSCGYVIEALIGTCIICLQNPNTSALSQYAVKYDLNLDGVIDDKDISMKAMGKNIAVVMSDSSFSCGNLLPCSLNALDDDVLLMGQTSGGGSCEVGYISTMLGSTMQISSENMLVTMKNGYIRDIDDGVAPEIPLSMNRMFDREYLVGVVNDYFG